MIRQFFLTNEKGEEWSLRPRGDSMLSNPSGTSEGLGSRTYWQGKRAFVRTDYKDQQSTISGTVNFRNAKVLSDFEQYIERSEELYLHCVRNDVPERFCRVECAITNRPEDFAGWVFVTVAFRRLNPWRNPGKSETKTLSYVGSGKFDAPGNGSLPSAFVLGITPTSSWSGTVSITDGVNTFATLSLTIGAGKMLRITSIEGEQSIYNDNTDVYDKINFATSTFFEIKPGADLSIVFGSTFNGKATLEIFDQWNEA